MAKARGRMTGRRSILVTRRLPDDVEAWLAAHFDVTICAADAGATRDELAAALRDCDALCPTITDRIDAALLAADSRVRVIASFGAGTEHIDLAAARRAGIVVTNTPDALTDTTADLAIMLMLMATRRAGEGERELRAGRWTGWRPTHLLGTSLTGKTLGLVGIGKIARATATRARGFGMEVVYHSRRPADVPFRRVESLADLGAEADIVSLHVPGGPETRHMIDAAFLGHAKPGCIIVNTARGSVIDEAALADALRDGRVAAAGLDVFEHEPAVHPDLLACENAVLLPHLGSATVETRTAMGMQMARNLEAFFAGLEPPNRVA